MPRNKNGCRLLGGTTWRRTPLNSQLANATRNYFIIPKGRLKWFSQPRIGRPFGTCVHWSDQPNTEVLGYYQMFLRNKRLARSRVAKS